MGRNSHPSLKDDNDNSSDSSSDGLNLFGKGRYGLCVTCKNSENCKYKRERAVQIVFCEEFEGALTENESKKGESIDLIKNNTEDVDGISMGLCKDCIKKDRCNAPKPIWGVWHCKDYK